MQGTAPWFGTAQEKCRKQCEEGEGHWLVKASFCYYVKKHLRSQREGRDLASGPLIQIHASMDLMELLKDSKGCDAPAAGSNTAQSCTLNAGHYCGVTRYPTLGLVSRIWKSSPHQELPATVRNFPGKK
jgi:hypothetical protein